MNKKVRIVFEDTKELFVAPINNETKKWGVYCIPYMWEDEHNNFYVKINGSQDNACKFEGEQAPDLFFSSNDNCKTWKREKDLNDIMPIFPGSEPHLIKLKDGTSIKIEPTNDNKKLDNSKFIKTVWHPNKEYLAHVYYNKDIPDECKKTTITHYDCDGNVIWTGPVKIDFPERELYSLCGYRILDGHTKEEDYTPIEDEYVFGPYVINGIVELDDGSLLGLFHGQNPDIIDKYYEVVYIMKSVDKGKTWTKLSLVAGYQDFLKFGYTYENSIARMPDKSLVVVMRTEHCVPLDIEPETPLMITRSFDNGITWEKAVRLADESTVPHIVTLKNGVVVLVYGRPGVHVRYSVDNGNTWSEQITLVGKTLKQHILDGDDYMACKYSNADTYANTCVFPISDDSIVICYTDLKYTDKDGNDHKATLIKKIQFCCED